MNLDQILESGCSFIFGRKIFPFFCTHCNAIVGESKDKVGTVFDRTGLVLLACSTSSEKQNYEWQFGREKVVHVSLIIFKKTEGVLRFISFILFIFSPITYSLCLVLSSCCFVSFRIYFSNTIHNLISAINSKHIRIRS